MPGRLCWEQTWINLHSDVIVEGTRAVSPILGLQDTDAGYPVFVQDVTIMAKTGLSQDLSWPVPCCIDVSV